MKRHYWAAALALAGACLTSGCMGFGNGQMMARLHGCGNDCGSCCPCPCGPMMVPSCYQGGSVFEGTPVGSPGPMLNGGGMPIPPSTGLPVFPGPTAVPQGPMPQPLPDGLATPTPAGPTSRVKTAG
jgi:hypothetical protein